MPKCEGMKVMKSSGMPQPRRRNRPDRAGPRDLAFFDNVRYADHLTTTKAGACLLAARFAERAPAPIIGFR